MPKPTWFTETLDQAVAFYQVLVDKSEGAKMLSREKISEIYKVNFKTEWNKKHPSKPCKSFSHLRHTLVSNGYLRRVKDQFHFQQHKSDSSLPDAKETGPKRGKRNRRRNVTRVAVDQHLAQSTVTKAAPTLPKKPVDEMEVIDRGYYCSLCNVTVATEEEAIRHSSGKKHRANIVMGLVKSARDILVSNKHSVTVKAEGMNNNQSGTIRLTIKDGERFNLVMSITNESICTPVVFSRCEFLRRVRVFTLSDQYQVTDGLDTYTIHPGMCYQVKVAVLANNVGSYAAALAFHFTFNEDADKESDSTFHIIRYISVKCEDREDLIEQLEPVEEYRPPPRISAKPVDVEIIPGVPLIMNIKEQLEKEIKLGSYFVDKYLRSLVNHGMKINDGTDEYRNAAKEFKRVLDEGLKAENHQHRFQTLLGIEEIQMEVDIRKYDMVGVTMTQDPKRPRLLALQVPGLAENRPSVLKNDSLYVREVDARGKPFGPEYRGHVHDIGPDHVYLGFGKKLQDKYIPGMKFHVRFEFHRLPLRSQHRSVQLAFEHSLSKMLFPSIDTASSTGSVPFTRIRHFDHRVAENKEQKAAVENILMGSSRPAPYLIFGPPGTGKTVTMVEAIKQVATRISSSHLLVCAPSNSAADLLTDRILAHIDKGWVYRMHAVSRDWSTVPIKVKEVSNYDKDLREYCFPAKATLCRYRIIVCTLVTAGRLVSANFPAGHFSHVFIDEAGHSTEPELLIPIAGVLDCDHDPDGGLEPAISGQCVLAGDPRQLGAVIRSPIATKYGFGLSFLERLMTTCDVYRRVEENAAAEAGLVSYNPKVLTKLVRNYRSHPAILDLPNKHFYDKELEVHADPFLRDSMCRWEDLPKKGFPVVFHGMTAQEKREERSPSFFNPSEVATVVSYVGKLLSTRSINIKLLPKEIGIISPYRKQVQKIRQALKIKKMSTDIKVGSVEEFQGQERHVIIISTVRTSPEYMGMDVDFKLGFLKNPKRFNVAVTRAKALLIVVGNPFVLSKDPHWNSFLEYCQREGGYVGVDYEPEDEQLEDIIQRFQDVKLDTTLQPSAKQSVEEPEWRKDD